MSAAASDGPVVFDPADFGAIPRSKELRSWMRKVRRGKADRTIWQQLEDIYVVAFALAMLGATGGNVLLKLNDNAPPPVLRARARGCSTRCRGSWCRCWCRPCCACC